MMCCYIDNGAEATKHLKRFLGEHYHYSDMPTLKALWHSYNNCQFVDDEGTLLIKNRRIHIVS